MTQQTIEVLTAGAGNIEINSGVSASGATIVTGNQKRYRREFNDPTLAEWDVVTGAGMAVAVANSNLTITTGTTINSTTTLTTKQSFQGPFKAAFGFKISQKIINQEFYLEVIAESTDGTTVDDTVVAAWRIAGSDSTTTTIARTEVRNGAAARLQSANLTAQATQTVDSVYEITLESDEVWFHSKPADSTAAKSASSVRNTVSPDPNRRYRLRLRVVNGGTAPASTTTATFSFVTCVDYTEFQMEVTGGTGSASPGQGVPVTVTGAIPGTTTIGGTVNVGASASVTGTTPAKVLSAATTNAQLIKNGAGRLYGYNFANTSASWRYVKFFNLAAAPVPGTSALFFQIALPPNASVDAEIAVPVSFATGIGIAITGASAELDATAIGAGEVLGVVYFL